MYTPRLKVIPFVTSTQRGFWETSQQIGVHLLALLKPGTPAQRLKYHPCDWVYLLDSHSDSLYLEFFMKFHSVDNHLIAQTEGVVYINPCFCMCL